MGRGNFDLMIHSTEEGVVGYTNFQFENNLLSLTGSGTGSDAFHISDGKLKVGDTDNVELSEDGVLLTGNATVWDDMRVALESAKTRGSTNIPNYSQLIDDGSGSDGVYAYSFAKGDQIFFSAQLPHSYLEGSTIHPHVHIVPSTAGAGTIAFGLEYIWTNVNELITNTSEITGIKDTNELLNEHLICSMTEIDGVGKNISSMLVCRLYRDNSGIDTYPDEVSVLEFDFHYQINSFGSKEEYVK